MEVLASTGQFGGVSTMANKDSLRPASTSRLTIDRRDDNGAWHIQSGAYLGSCVISMPTNLKINTPPPIGDGTILNSWGVVPRGGYSGATGHLLFSHNGADLAGGAGAAGICGYLLVYSIHTGVPGVFHLVVPLIIFN